MLLCGGSATAQMKVPGWGQVARPAADKPAARRRAAQSQPIARELFGAATEPAPLAARAIGSYAKGCLAARVVAHQRPGLASDAAVAHRNWGTPRCSIISSDWQAPPRALLLAGALGRRHVAAARRPMLNGHTSHQVGLDADFG